MKANTDLIFSAIITLIVPHILTIGCSFVIVKGIKTDTQSQWASADTNILLHGDGAAFKTTARNKKAFMSLALAFICLTICPFIQETGSGLVLSRV